MELKCCKSKQSIRQKRSLKEELKDSKPENLSINYRLMLKQFVVRIYISVRIYRLIYQNIYK